jgi:hypothetical protein
MRQTHVAHVFDNSCFPTCSVNIETIRNVLLQVKKYRKRRHVLMFVTLSPTRTEVTNSNDSGNQTFGAWECSVSSDHICTEGIHNTDVDDPHNLDNEEGFGWR